jgi:hypothetical protein
MQSLLYGVAVLAGGREMLLRMMCRSDAAVVEQRFSGLAGRSAAGVS